MNICHSSLYILEYLIPLLGMDMLHKLGATIHLLGDKLETGVPLDKEAEDDNVNN